MYILGISGSPRKGGNTETLLDEALRGAGEKGAETEKVILNNLKMVPCQECGKVKDDGTCKVEDDFSALYEKIMKADAIILAAPIFFGSLSAQAKIMIDRFQCQWRYKYVLKKPAKCRKKTGALILAEASQRQSFLENAKSIARNFFATVNADYREELFCPGLEGKGDIRKHPDFLQKAFKIGRRLTPDETGL